MTLCIVCQSIPFRELAMKRLPLAWRTSSWDNVIRPPIVKDKPVWTCDRYRTTLTHLRQSSPSCSLCSAIVNAIETSDTVETAKGYDGLYGADTPATDFDTPWMHILVDETMVSRRVSTPMMKLFLMNDPPGDHLLQRYTRAVQFTMPFGRPMSEFFPPVELRDSLVDAVSKRMRTWLNQCDSEHSTCSHISQALVTLPTRLLDLGTLPTYDEMIGRESNWPLLSLELLLGHIFTVCQHHQDYVGAQGWYYFSHLPRTLKDAVIVCRYLGIQYIWIDCLCIVQDDKADWEREALRMADVYSQSYLTIAAARAAYCGEGFLGPRQTPAAQCAQVHDDEGKFELYFVASPRYEQPLYTRSWVMQEQCLSPRVLHFKSDGMSWDCSVRDNEGRHGEFVSNNTKFALQIIADWLSTSTDPLIGSSP